MLRVGAYVHSPGKPLFLRGTVLLLLLGCESRVVNCCCSSTRGLVILMPVADFHGHPLVSHSSSPASVNLWFFPHQSGPGFSKGTTPLKYVNFIEKTNNRGGGANVIGRCLLFLLFLTFVLSFLRKMERKFQHVHLVFSSNLALGKTVVLGWPK